MSFDPNVSNRLHRSGAIDFNVAFDLRHANKHRAPSGKNRESSKAYSDVTDNDSYSVCEGEPLYQVSNKRAKFGGGCAMTRKPIQLLSSLNGIELDRQAILDLQNEVVTYPAFEQACICDKERDVYFGGRLAIRPTGVSVSKWNFGAAGKQGDLFVATLGGANTVYVDDDVYAGDTLIVDMPMDDDTVNKGCNEENPYGFIAWQKKKGVPNAKRTLVVRALPTAHHSMPSDMVKEFKNNFYLRQQVLGQCTKGAKRGERCDLILGKNAIGI